MDKKSSEQKRPRIPLEYNGVQVNFCKNPLCKNFGVPAGLDKQKRGASKPKEGQDSYTLSGAGKDSPTIHCLLCNEYPPVKSNKGISEELDRISDYLKDVPEKTCPDPNCDNHTVGIKSNKKSYQSFGKTRSGSPRYRCKSCNKTFSIKRPTTGHKKPHVNKKVFSSLVNKMVFNRLCEKDEISAGTLYPKIDFIYKQCLAFVANRERNFSKREMERLYVSVDRQEYIVNWTKRKDKRNIKLIAAGCADNDSMYVFGMHLNYEPNVDETQIEEDAIQAGDYDVPFLFRKYARCWLKQDYDQSVLRGIKRNAQRSERAELTDRINNTYNAVNDLDDVEVSEFHTHTTSLPKRGVQIHSEYTLYGHFFFLNKQFSGIEKVRFFLDQDSGIRAACLAAFQERVSNRTCDVFYVRLTKDMTINEKQQEVNKFKKRLKLYQADNPFLSEEQIKVLMTQDAINSMSEIGKWRDRWLLHPLPNMSEPEKAVCYLTDYKDYDFDHLARLYNKSSMHGIDQFFMQVRRRIAPLERPISSSSSTGRKWYGYAPYNPEMVIKLLEIYRVFYNYCKKGLDKKTPAMRLGLAKEKVDMEDIIYYQ